MATTACPASIGAASGGTGDYLPSYFRRYEVRDFWEYGLQDPPYGCAWVWVDNNIVLMDLYDGYIIDVVYNVW
jgi:Ni/Co efflux regulator RcnB